MYADLPTNQLNAFDTLFFYVNFFIEVFFLFEIKNSGDLERLKQTMREVLFSMREVFLDVDRKMNGG